MSRQNLLFKFLLTALALTSLSSKGAVGAAINESKESNESKENTKTEAAGVNSENKPEAKSEDKPEDKSALDATPTPASLKINPALIPHLVKAHAYLSHGDNQKAIVSLNEALKIDPKSAAVTRYLAYAKLRSGQSKEALKIMQSLSHRETPNNFDWYIFAESYYAQNADAIAVACFEQSLKLSPGYDAARAGLVKALARLHMYDRARQEIATGFGLSSDQKVREFYDELKETLLNVERVDTESRPGQQTGMSQEQMSRVGEKPVVINPGLSTDGN